MVIPGASAMDAQTPVSLAVARLPYSLGFFVAEAQGYFASEGVPVRIIDCFPGRICLNLVLDGKAELATAADVPIVVASFARSDFSVVATIATSSNDANLLVKKSAGIAAPKDLVGKRVGVVKGTSSDYFLDTFLLFYGIDPVKVKKVNLNPTDVVVAISRDQVDAVVAFQPSLTDAAKALGRNGMILSNPKIYTTTFNLVAAKRILAKGDDAVEKILRALVKAEMFIAADPAAAKKIMQRKLTLDAASIDAIFPNLEFEIGLDQTFLKTMESEARWLGQQGGNIGTRPTNYLDFVYTQPLSRVAPASITLIK